MWKKFTQFLLLLIWVIPIHAQQIVSGEYFFDTAPNHGAGTPISFTASANVNHSFTVPTTGLSTGIHQLYIRVRNDANVWSHYQKRMVYVIEPLVVVNTQIIAAEWFIDQDPGVGNGTPISVTAGTTVAGTLSIPTNLASGIHHLYIRVKDDLGKWSHQQLSMFYILTPPVDNSTTIVAGEYFFDTDPGVGNGVTINVTPSNSINHAFSVSSNGLSTGVHHMYIRMKNDRGQWGHHQHRLVYINGQQVSENKNIIAAEYFLDTDPGLGLGTAISVTSGTSVLQDFTLNTTSIPLGEHFLYIRVKEDNGRWSHYAKHKFLICNDVLQAPSISGTSAVCQNSTLSLTGSIVTNATSYYWTGPNGFTQAGNDLNIPNISDAQGGLYTFYAVRSGSSACDTSYSEISVSVLPTSFNVNTQQICEGQTYSINGNNYSVSGTYLDTFPSMNGCDSIVETQLTVLPAYHFDNVQQICQGESYTYNGNTYTTSGTYVDAFTTINGCDSIITTYLTVHPTYTVNNPQTICTGGSYSINGNTYTTEGTYTDVLSTVNGCDSTVITQLTVVNSFSVSNPQTICDGESYSIGNNTYTQAGTYTDVFTSIQGCDSIVTTILTVNTVYSVSNPQTICQGESYQINGNTYTITGTYTDVMQSINGCDSTVITQLTVTQPSFNLTVVLDNHTLIAQDINASYQWLDCNGFQEIPNATNQSYTATVNGQYAVQLTSLGCNFVDTSECIIIDNLNISDKGNDLFVKIYPNPSHDKITLQFNEKADYLIKIYNAEGKIIFEKRIDSTSEIDLTNWNNGVYNVEIQSDDNLVHRRFIKQ